MESRDGRRGGILNEKFKNKNPKDLQNIKNKNNTEHYSPPWKNGFDVCFSTEQSVPTWNPMENQEVPTRYWTGPETFAKENLDGDDSRVIMDRVLTFIKNSVESNNPFFAVIWFHTPHHPVIAGNEYRNMYMGSPIGKQHYLGSLTAMDEQIGRLRNEIKDLNVDQNTMIWFCSDNGPARANSNSKSKYASHLQGSTGQLRGHKGSLYEGGIRVPGILVWPEMISSHKTLSVPCTTNDFFPTIADFLGYDIEKKLKRPLDGISLLPLIQGKKFNRMIPLAFETPTQISLIDGKYKLIGDAEQCYELYDLEKDGQETTNIADRFPDKVQWMKDMLEIWKESCRRSLSGKDYE